MLEIISFQLLNHMTAYFKFQHKNLQEEQRFQNSSRR